MDRMEQLRFLNDILLEEMPQYRVQAVRFTTDDAGQRRLLRCLMNVRPPMPLQDAFLRVQDELLSGEREARGVVDAGSLPSVAAESRIAVWQGDITRLRADAVVNAANSALLGCFHPCHGCIDNAIHSAAGLQLREACRRIIAAQDHEEPLGRARLTRGYNLPARFVLHTVGPAVKGVVKGRDRELLRACYRACLEAAVQGGLHTIAFCCISTGEYRFPGAVAAEIAVATVREYLGRTEKGLKVIFNVYRDQDAAYYRELLGAD